MLQQYVTNIICQMYKDVQSNNLTKHHTFTEKAMLTTSFNCMTRIIIIPYMECLVLTTPFGIKWAASTNKVLMQLQNSAIYPCLQTKDAEFAGYATDTSLLCAAFSGVLCME
jgi:hypothetical protein